MRKDKDEFEREKRSRSGNAGFLFLGRSVLSADSVCDSSGCGCAPCCSATLLSVSNMSIFAESVLLLGRTLQTDLTSFSETSRNARERSLKV